jgi:hypothetical protein
MFRKFLEAIAFSVGSLPSCVSTPTRESTWGLHACEGQPLIVCSDNSHSVLVRLQRTLCITSFCLSLLQLVNVSNLSSISFFRLHGHRNNIPSVSMNPFVLLATFLSFSLQIAIPPASIWCQEASTEVRLYGSFASSPVGSAFVSLLPLFLRCCSFAQRTADLVHC